MKYSQIEKIITDGDLSAWHQTVVASTTSDQDVFVFFNDINLRICVSARADEEFDEAWVRVFPDKRAKRIDGYVYYANSPIYQFGLVAVDGHRAFLPMPKSATELAVRKFDYEIARVATPNIDEFEIKFRHAKLSVLK